MTMLTNKTWVAGWVLTGALLLGTRMAATAPVVRQAGPDALQLVDDSGQAQAAWTVPCRIQDLLQLDQTLYVACGPSGVLIFDLATPQKPAPCGQLAEGRNVVKLAHNGKSLLVVVADFSALTFSLADPQKPLPDPLAPPTGGRLATLGIPRAPGRDPGESERLPVDPDAPPRAPRSSWAPVTAVRGGWVAVTPSGPVQVGDRFIIRSQRRTQVSDPTHPQKLYAPSDQAMGMFVVTRVHGDVASGPLPRGTVVHRGDLAEPTAAPLRAPLVAPQLWYGMGRFYGTLRPIIGVGSTSSSSFEAAGFGMLSDFTLEYYFRVPVKLGVQVAPLGLTVGTATGVSSEVRALFSFASSYFELGLEPGVELHRLGPSRLLLGYMLRLGSLDGLNLSFHNSYSLDLVSTRLAFGSANLEINIPLARRFNLYLTGGGALSWAYGTVGLKYYLRGGGGPGTVVLASGAGGAWVSDQCTNGSSSTNAAYCRSAARETLGPALALGLDARF